jgi:hypothetical protein
MISVSFTESDIYCDSCFDLADMRDMIDLLKTGTEQVETTNCHSVESATSREHLTKLTSQICDLTSTERCATTSWMRLSGARMDSDPQRCLNTVPQHRRRLFFSFARTDVSQSSRTTNVSVKVMSHTRIVPWDPLKYALVIDSCPCPVPACGMCPSGSD